jgi:signal transduction histidine kinase
VNHTVIIAALAVVASTAIRYLIDPLLGRDAPMLVYVLGVSIAAVRGGVGAGILATIASIPVGTLLFIEPRWALTPLRHEDAVRLIVFAAEGLLISYATGQLRVRVEENRRLAEHVRRHNQELEDQVARRTSELQEQAAELQASNEALETFAHTISHDIRAPLRSIRAFSEILEEDFVAQLPPDARHYTSRISAAAHRLEELVENLLAYTRLGRRAIPPESVSLDRVVKSALSHLGPDIRQAQASVTVSNSPLGNVIGHADTIELMIANVVSNAIKFIRAGVLPEIVIASTATDGFVRLSVRDNGIGVSDADQVTVFQPFERLHSNQDYPGTGLGLALVARGAERMGGRCGVISSGVEGSEFWVELPAARKEGTVVPSASR